MNMNDGNNNNLFTADERNTLNLALQVQNSAFYFQPIDFSVDNNLALLTPAELNCIRELNQNAFDLPEEPKLLEILTKATKGFAHLIVRGRNAKSKIENLIDHAYKSTVPPHISKSIKVTSSLQDELAPDIARMHKRILFQQILAAKDKCIAVNSDMEIYIQKLFDKMKEFVLLRQQTIPDKSQALLCVFSTDSPMMLRGTAYYQSFIAKVRNHLDNICIAEVEQKQKTTDKKLKFDAVKKLKADAAEEAELPASKGDITKALKNMQVTKRNLPKPKSKSIQKIQKKVQPTGSKANAASAKTQASNQRKTVTLKSRNSDSAKKLPTAKPKRDGPSKGKKK